MTSSLLCIIVPVMALVFFVYLFAYDRGYKKGIEQNVQRFVDDLMYNREDL